MSLKFCQFTEFATFHFVALAAYTFYWLIFLSYAHQAWDCLLARETKRSYAKICHEHSPKLSILMNERDGNLLKICNNQQPAQRHKYCLQSYIKCVSLYSCFTKGGYDELLGV